MKGQLYRILSIFTVVVVLAAVILYQGKALRNTKDLLRRYTSNIETLKGQVDTFRTKNGELAAKVSSLELKEKDFRRIMAEDAASIRSLKKRNEELEHLVQAKVDTKVAIQTVVKDTVIYRDAPVKLKVIEWSDSPWEHVYAEIMDDNVVRMAIRHHDEVDVAVFLQYRKFLWWKTKVKGCSVDVVSHNPYAADIDVASVRIL